MRPTERLSLAHGHDVSIDSFREAPVVWNTRLAALRHAFDCAGAPPVALEFGVWQGRSLSMLAGYAPETRFFGFDSFEGLPEDWKRSADSTYRAGHFAVDALPPMPRNVTLVKGFFADVLPGWVAGNPQKVGFVHIDCDLRSSTEEVLEILGPQLADDCVIVFDELSDWAGSGVYPLWPEGEWAAMTAWLERTGRRFRVVCRDREFSAAIALCPEGGDPVVPVARQALSLVRHGHPVAREVAEALAADSPAHPSARLPLVRAEAGKLSPGEIAAIAAEVGEGPGRGALMAELSAAARVPGGFETALSCAEAAVAAAPHDIAAHVALGEAQAALRNYEAAVAAYDTVVVLDPTRQRTDRRADLARLARTRPEFREVQFGGLILQEIVDRYPFHTVLDIGSGSGEQADLLRSFGKAVTEIDYGQSPYFEAGDRAREVITADFLEHDFGGRLFDCVIASHVLEHQKDVNRFLTRIAGLMREGSVLAVTVPPSKPAIVGGHLTLWNAGLLLYNLAVAGFDCSDAIVRKYGYNISVALRYRKPEPVNLTWDTGDVDRLRARLPRGLSEGFDGNIAELN